jgi:hypothetical protein
MKGILVFLMIFCFAQIAGADEVYRWVDERGVTHFTDNPAAVPEDYRSETDRREMSGSLATVWPGEGEDEAYDGILIEDDFKEKDETWWRNLADKWRQRQQAAYDEYERLRLRYNELATEFNASKDPKKREKLKAELDQLQIEMKEFMAHFEKARKMMEEVLPSRAQKAGKPLDWVR